ncbi:hypothetical protein DPMN_094069 [Dreissena polymorpha]|uniref:Uncharacterized protein n=2 Tax=Dreissena polymorpha TaxID=45954 RepID=A0A9D4L442_DREPO|nr:hypothetical protein DPMN_094069 [Dreissena polymorpha]
MEHYMKRSTSSSGSLSSTNKGFPTVIPNFEDQEQKRHSKNRDSCISTGSNSSYDSTTDLSSEPHQEERMVHTIKARLATLPQNLLESGFIIQAQVWRSQFHQALPAQRLRMMRAQQN